MQSAGMRHPREMGAADVEAILSMLTNDQVAGLLAQVKGVTALQTSGTADL